MAQGATADSRLVPSWVPDATKQWAAPDGPLHNMGTLAQLCVSAAGHTIVRREIDARVAELIGELASVGVRRGDAVGWQMPNCTDSVAMYRACWEIGVVAVPLHHLAGRAEVEAMLASVSPVAFLSSDGRLEPRDSHTNNPPKTPNEPPSPADVAVVLHTSGSSGSPKGVMHTHRALAYKARTMARLHGLGPTDVVLMPAPLAHVSGLLNGLLVPAVAGMRSVLMDRWNPESALELIESQRVTFMAGPPTFFVGLEQAGGFSPARVESLRILSLGGAGVSPEFVERTSQVFGAEVKRSYGSTEAPTVASSASRADPWSMANTDGRPTGAVQIRTTDPSTDRPTAVGSPGEVQLSGPELFCGYVDAAQNATATAGDWFRTGDLGLLDEEGRLTITGRIGNVIIRGGENVDAAEVEAHLVAHPEVSAAVALGEPDDRLGERVVAVVERAPGAEPFDLEMCRTWFESRGVARFKTPERIVEVAQLPLLAAGKVDRSEVERSLGHK